MKILYVYQFCTLGGVETVLRNRLPAFYKRSIFPHVVFLSDMGGSKVFEGFKNIRYENRENELLQIIEEGRFDFIIPIDTPQIYPVLKKSHFEGVLITEVHTSNLNILRYLSDIGETETKAIITPSQFEKELVFREIRRFEKTGIPVFVIPNPINLDFFYFKEPKTKLNKKVIGWVGRLEEQKNWNHFLDIASGLSEKRDELLFLIVGGHYADEKIKKKFLSTVKELNLIDCLKWVSYLQYDRMPGVYSLMGASGGCFVATSTLESFGMTVIEAMACRCPVVASRIGSIEEIIEEGKNGLLFELNNSRDAVAKIESLIDNTSEKERLIKSGWVGVTETYSPVRVIDKYIEVLKELAE